MLENNKLKIFLDLINNSTKEEVIWLNGYLNGIVSNNQIEEKQTPPKGNLKKVTIAYGTETGNSKKVATDFAARAKSHGIHAKVQSLEQYKLTDLIKEEYFLTVISTHGDGEPPAAAKKFYDHVLRTSSKMDHLKYSVLALGDTSYPLFCKAGEDVDEQFNKLGAKRIAPLQKCDIDYDSEVSNWFEQILIALNGQNGNNASTIKQAPSKKIVGKKTYKGNIIAHVNLNDRGSNKETFHIEIESSDAQYLPGDSLGIIPWNDEALVKKIIELSSIDGKMNIEYKNELISIQELLKRKLNILYLPERVVKKYADIVKQDIPETKMDLLDLLKIYPVKDPDQFLQVVMILENIAPRLYSIASSPVAHEGEIHITVARNSFTIDNQLKFGLGSNYLSEFKKGEIDFYLHPNNNFRLPEEDKNMIMIGPGTGIAPFRSFLAERDACGATGKNWLFFGEQHFTTDFLYQTEIQNWMETGVLTKITTAFSRDQQEKIYVQHRMMENKREIFEWLETGSYFYICGTKDPMSKDVENTLLKIIMEVGSRSEKDAVAYLDSLKEDGRYVLDVY